MGRVDRWLESLSANPGWASYVNEAWKRFDAAGLASPHFERELTKGYFNVSFHRIWKMMVGIHLLECGLRVTAPRRDGHPDFLCEGNGFAFWVEATCATPGQDRDLAPDAEWLSSGGSVPLDNILLRWTAAISSKQQAGARYRENGVTVTPHPQESLIGYVYRLAEARRPMTPGAIAVECGMRRPPSNRPRPGTLDKLAELAGVPLADIESLSWGPLNRTEVRFRGLVLPGRSIGLREQAPRRVCPGCLADRAYHRAIWDFIFASACPIHARMLLDSCRSCGRNLWWAGADVAHCGRCLGGDLTAIRTADLPEEDLRGIRVVYGLFREPGFEADANYARTLAPFRDLGDGPIAVFLYRAGLFLLGSRYEPFSFQTPDDLYPHAHLALARGLSLAEDWPGSFEAALDAMRRRYPGMGREQALGKSAGAVERWLDGLPPGEGGAIREACRHYRDQVGAAA